MLNNILNTGKRNIANAILALLFISLLLNFVSSSWSRVFFFLASYVSIIAVGINWKNKPDRVILLITLALVLIGMSKLMWFYFEYIENPAYNKYNPYYNTGQRLILGAVISYALFSMADKTSVLKTKITEKVIIGSFCIATIVGIFQIVNGSYERIDFYLGFATDSAYMYSTLSICSVLYLQRYKSLALRILTVATLLISLFIIFKTGTRNIFICYPVILLLSLFAWKKNSARNIFLCSAILVFSFLISYHSYIKPKINATVNEIQLYENDHGNKNGSLTARLAMWSVGYEAFKNSPLSMSLEQREAFFKENVNETKRNRSALSFTKIHLHNELIETASLQGIQGIVALILTYFLLLFSSIKYRNNALLGVSLTIITVGLSDVVFISREQTIFFSIVLILVALQGYIEQKKKPSVKEE